MSTDYDYSNWTRVFKLCVAIHNLGLVFPNSASLETYWTDRHFKQEEGL